MPTFSPELIEAMRAAVDEVMTKIPPAKATPALKAHLAQFIVTAAEEGQTSYESLMAEASDQIPTMLSMLIGVRGTCSNCVMTVNLTAHGRSRWQPPADSILGLTVRPSRLQ